MHGLGLVVVACSRTPAPATGNTISPVVVADAAGEPEVATVPVSSAGSDVDRTPAWRGRERLWLRQVRDQLRTIDLQRCAGAGVVDTACVCVQICALAVPAPPEPAERTIDWSDGVRLQVAPDGAVTRCRARPAAGAAWEEHSCTRAGPPPRGRRRATPDDGNQPDRRSPLFADLDLPHDRDSRSDALVIWSDHLSGIIAYTGSI